MVNENMLKKDLIKSINNNDIIMLVNGVSMNPFLKSGDYIRVTKISYKSLQTGDIIVYKYHGDIIVHRIKKKNLFYCICKGDNTKSSEKIIRYQIVGKIIGMYRNNKYISLNE